MIFSKRNKGVKTPLIPREKTFKKRLSRILKTQKTTNVKKIFNLVSTIIKYGSFIAVVLNIAKVAMEEMAEKFPELLEEEEDETGEASPVPTTPISPEEKESKFKFKLPW